MFHVNLRFPWTWESKMAQLNLLPGVAGVVVTRKHWMGVTGMVVTPKHCKSVEGMVITSCYHPVKHPCNMAWYRLDFSTGYQYDVYYICNSNWFSLDRSIVNSLTGCIHKIFTKSGNIKHNVYDIMLITQSRNCTPLDYGFVCIWVLFVDNNR